VPETCRKVVLKILSGLAQNICRQEMNVPNSGIHQKFPTRNVVPDGERKSSLLKLFNVEGGWASSSVLQIVFKKLPFKTDIYH
jgi:hypothetical protein